MERKEREMDCAEGRRGVGEMKGQVGRRI